MLKRIFVLALAIVMIFSLGAPAFAAENAVRYFPSLVFNGNVAECSVSISAIGQEIDARLELWYNNARIAYYPDSGTDYLYIEFDKNVNSGLTYSLVVVGTIDDVPFESTPLVRTCP